MRLNESFLSIQGEGKFVGRPTLFIRAFGCNLDCSWCDQPNALTTATARGVNPRMQELSAEEVADLISAHPVETDVCFTGGEPTLQFREILDVITLVRRADEAAWDPTPFEMSSPDTRQYTMESNGMIFLPDYVTAAKKVFLSCSPKFQNVMIDQKVSAHGEPALKQWLLSGIPMQFKFVIETRDWFLKIVDWAERFVPLNTRHRLSLYFQPEWFKGRPEFSKVVKEALEPDNWTRYTEMGFASFCFLPQAHKALMLR